MHVSCIPIAPAEYKSIYLTCSIQRLFVWCRFENYFMDFFLYCIAMAIKFLSHVGYSCVYGCENGPFFFAADVSLLWCIGSHFSLFSIFSLSKSSDHNHRGARPDLSQTQPATLTFPQKTCFHFHAMLWILYTAMTILDSMGIFGQC